MLYLMTQRESAVAYPSPGFRFQGDTDTVLTARRIPETNQASHSWGAGLCWVSCRWICANQLCALFWILIWLSHRGPSFTVIVQHRDINRSVLGLSWTKFPQAICNGEILAGISIQPKEQVPNYPFLNAAHTWYYGTDRCPNRISTDSMIFF